MKTIKRIAINSIVVFCAVQLAGCGDAPVKQEEHKITVIPKKQSPKPPAKYLSGFYPKLSLAALERTKHHVVYDGSYKEIPYPWGDVDPGVGVCTDVVIRSYRKLGIDLQQLIYEDRLKHPENYPDLRSGKVKPNPSIDHRRVRNMKAFFKHNALAMPITHNPRHYRPGDLVTWKLPGDFDHIGIVVNKRSPNDPNRYMIVHNLAEGPIIEDILFTFKIDGHYRYFGNKII